MIPFSRRPGFVPGRNGSLFMLEMLPAQPSRLVVVLIAPFAEEMNKCRRMMVLQAESLAASGLRAILFDLSGTGDSEGDFSAATVARWREDIATIADYARSSGSESIVWLGVRFGALLASELAQSTPRSAGLVCWQPVQSGRQVISQILRLQVAARITAAAAASAPDPRAVLSAGGSVEIAGYELSAALVEQVEKLDLKGDGKPMACPVAWYEVVAEAGQELGPASRRIADLWGRDGVFVDTATVTGESFWSTVEVSVAPELIRRTTDVVTRWSQHA